MRFLGRLLRIVVREAAIVAAHEAARTLTRRALQREAPKRRTKKSPTR